MTESMEQRIAKLEAEISRLTEAVKALSIEEVGGNVEISIGGPVQELSISTCEVRNDMSIGITNAGGVTIDTDEVDNDLGVSVTGSGGVDIDVGEVGEDLSVQSQGSVSVSAGDVGGSVTK